MDRIRDFYATKEAKHHMKQKHNVEWHEVEEVMWTNPLLRKTTPSPNGQRRYYTMGQTSVGRSLVVILAKESSDTLRVVTAYEPKTKKQRRRFRSKKS